MRFLKVFLIMLLTVGAGFASTLSMAQGQDYSGNEDPNKKILKQGLLGAGVGAISAEASGGKAGTGALVGAGTNVIGGALLDTLTTPSQPRPQQVQYVQQAPVQQQTYSTQSYPVQTQGTAYRVDQPVQYVQQPAYYAPPQENQSQKIIKQGLLGAGVGAISASASGGKAGKGALIGAGTNVIGGALLDSLMGGSQPQQQQPVYYQQAPGYQQAPSYQQNQQYTSTSQPKKKIIRKYDSDGNVVSEEEVWE
jgi:hypothetical protein